MFKRIVFHLMVDLHLTRKICFVYYHKVCCLISHVTVVRFLKAYVMYLPVSILEAENCYGFFFFLLLFRNKVEYMYSQL